MNSIDEEKVKKALEADLDTLYSALGYSVNQDKIGVSPPSRDKLFSFGKEWFEKRKKEIEQIICMNKVVISQYLKPDTGIGDSVTIALLLGDLLLSKFGVTPAIYISSIVIKIGLNKFCNDLR